MPVNPGLQHEEFSMTVGPNRWVYGYSQYEKTIQDMSKPSESITDAISYGNTAAKYIAYVWPSLADMVSTVTSSLSSSVEYVYGQTFTCYYVFVIDPNNIKRMAGEWTLGQGGRAARDQNFDTQFEPGLLAAQNDIEVVGIVNTNASSPGAFSLDTLKTTLIQGVQQKAPPLPTGGGGDGLPSGGSTSNTPILIGLAVLVAYLLWKRK